MNSLELISGSEENCKSNILYVRKNNFDMKEIINFILDNRDVGQIIIDYLEVENKVKNSENLHGSRG